MGDSMKDLSSRSKYDVKLVHTEGGITQADVTWTMGVDRKGAADAVLELLVMKEKDPDAFQGDIIVQEVTAAILCPRCEADGVDRCGPRFRSVQGSGRDVPGGRVPSIKDWARYKEVIALYATPRD
jgi:hypothetical protein